MPRSEHGGAFFMDGILFYTSMGPGTQFNFLLRYISSIFLCFFSLSIHAAAPVEFGKWTEAGGTVSVDCPAGFTCEQNVSSLGISVMTLIDPDGNRYFHQVMSETGVDGTQASSESFVGKALQSDTLAESNGIALKQQVATTLDDSMTSTVQLNTGWSNDNTEPGVEITQSIKETTDYSVFNEAFSFKADRDDLGEQIGHKLELTQSLDFISTGSGGQSVVDENKFIHRQASGTQTPTAGSVSFPDGSEMTWQSGDSLRGTWIGQDCVGCSGASNSSSNVVGAMFSLQTFDNVSDGELEIYTRNIFSIEPPVWGSAPFDEPAKLP